MKSYLILSSVGPDRPGLVDEVSAGLSAKNLNIESSRMAVLGGEFAIILLASGEAGDIEAVIADPAKIGAGLQVFARKAAGPETRQMPASLPYRIVGSSMDHPGIVHEVSAVLHKFNVNIESLDTLTVPAPVSGAPVFTMRALLSVPGSVKIKALKEALEEVGDELNMDIDFMPADDHGD